MNGITPPPKTGDPIEDAKIGEHSISTKAIDFEKSSFVAENKSKASKKPSVDKADSQKTQDSPDEPDDTVPTDAEDNDTSDRKVSGGKGSFTEEELDFDNSEAEEFEQMYGGADEEDTQDDLPPEQIIDNAMQEIADQPFEVAMENLGVSKTEVLNAAKGVFSEKGYFEMRFSLPFGEYVVLKSKTINDFVDYNEYVRRLLADPLSQKEYDTFTQMRNLAYAIAEIDGKDYRDTSIEERYQIVSNMSEIKVTAIINSSVKFWRTAHLLLHPKAIDFLLSSQEA